MKKRLDKEDVVTVNTDASYEPNRKTGGYGIWIKSNFFTIKKAGQFKGQVNDSNEAEIKALINALHILKKNPRKFKGLVINCDNAAARDIVNTGRVAERFKEEGNKLKELLKDYKFAKAKVIRGHKDGHNARQWVNNWCDNASKEYRRKEMSKEIKKLEKEISDLEYMATGLTYEHQQEVKLGLLSKVEALKSIVKDLKQKETEE